MTPPATVRLCVSAIVLHEDQRILVGLRCEPCRWELPGGFVDPGEDLAAAVKREVAEEADLDIDVASVAGVHLDVPNELVCFSFLCIARTLECSPSAEMTEFRWLTIDESLAVLHPIYRNRLEVARTKNCLVEHHVGARTESLLSYASLSV
jgi:8-oxo-dGTP diphosphatase